MKKVSFLAIALISVATLSSCNNKCHECHYEDANGAEVELGEQCGDDLENYEENGIVVDGTTYEVHCHEH